MNLFIPDFTLDLEQSAAREAQWTIDYAARQAQNEIVYQANRAIWDAEDAAEEAEEELRIAKEAIEEELRIIEDQINEKNNLQKNILNIMELYDIFSPILKEKYVIEKIINMKCDMELCKLRHEYDEKRQELIKL